jgi:hypothetical protein
MPQKLKIQCFSELTAQKKNSRFNTKIYHHEELHLVDMPAIKFVRKSPGNACNLTGVR